MQDSKITQLAVLYMDGKINDLSRCKFRREVMQKVREIIDLLNYNTNTLA